MRACSTFIFLASGCSISSPLSSSLRLPVVSSSSAARAPLGSAGSVLGGSCWATASSSTSFWGLSSFASVTESSFSAGTSVARSTTGSGSPAVSGAFSTEGSAT
jgi:hypothetical protein